MHADDRRRGEIAAQSDLDSVCPQTAPDTPVGQPNVAAHRPSGLTKGSRSSHARCTCLVIAAPTSGTLHRNVVGHNFKGA
jgi:hypothetical protein